MRLVKPFQLSIPGLVLLSLCLYGLPGGALADEGSSLLPPLDIKGPEVITGTLYAIGSDRQKILFHFKRTASQSGSLVEVQRDFTSPQGLLAASETVVYRSQHLVSYKMREYQANLHGDIEVQPDPKHPDQSQMRIAFGDSLATMSSSTQTLKPDTLIDDEICPFMMFHWDDLMRGESVKFHFVSLEWKRTFNFRLFKSGETTVGGKLCEQIEMQPSGFVLSKLINPLYFSIEKSAPHHILAYIGRTVPRVKDHDSWKYLDVETIFDPYELPAAK